MTMPSGETLRYEDAGVNIERGNALVHAIKAMSRRTHRPGVIGGIGGFGAVFDLAATAYHDPLLVVSTDGVGTKLKLEASMGFHHAAGIDLVAMSVNDILTQGAEPLFFLDYIATASLNLDATTALLEGITQGCEQAGCALIGGETAEMPGMYALGEYDLAGFALGVVERHQLLPRDVASGDVLLALPSSGLHANGFSLVRHIATMHGIDWLAQAPFVPDRNQSYAQAMLAPTTIYVKPCLAALRAGHVKAMAHITGGGLVENIPRVLPSGMVAEINAGSWTIPPLFHWLSTMGPVTDHEMVRTFNCGIGMVLVVDRADVVPIQERLRAHDMGSWVIGAIREADAMSADASVVIQGLDGLFSRTSMIG